MPFLPSLTEGAQTRALIENFAGYNHNLRIAEGEWYAEENLSSDHFPMFSQRRRRAVYKDGLFAPGGLIAKDALAYVDDGVLYYNGLPVEGIELSTTAEDNPKQLVSMGAYICIFPDGVYVNTADLTDRGRMAATFESVENAQITYTPCRLDGTDYDMSGIISSASEPEEPSNGQYWLDTSTSPNVLKQYSASSGMWVEIPTVYTKISVSGIGALFSAYDGVTISGAVYSEGDDEAVSSQIAALNTDTIIQACGSDYIIVVGMLNEEYVQEEGSIKVARSIPKMTYVCEANNRLWGCFYGMINGEMVNEIFCCKQGDFKNWNSFAGLSTDSYRVSVGSDGEFTGCISHLGFPLFFKENCIHKLYGTIPANFTLNTTTCRGVQRGSARSLAIVNETLYYKSRSDICAYDGNLPVGISPQFGTDLYYDARAGAHDGKYYVSMRDSSGGWHLFVYDTQRGVWHREDAVKAMGFAAWGDELFFIDESGLRIIAENGTVGEAEGPVVWRAESGLIGYELVDHQYISRFNFRMRLGEGARCELYIEYDSDGEWHYEGIVYGGALNSFVIPVVPRRCDHFRLRLVGAGDIKIYSMAKILEQGSDG